MPLRTALRALALAAALLASSAANAQLFRAYLAITGNDANPCTLPQPCRLLPAALAAVASGGEIWMLDSANYNTATVNVAKSVTILAVPGAVGSVVATGGPAINLATSGVNVVLRNLVIVPLPGAGGTRGVQMTAGDSLVVEGCSVSGVPSGGILASGPAAVKVTGSTIRTPGDALRLENGARGTVTRSVLSSAGNYAVVAYGNAAGTTTTASIAGSTLEGSFVGAFAWSDAATATATISVRDSQVDRNEFGLYAYSVSGGPARIAASNNVVTNTLSHAIAADGVGAKAWATGNTVADNASGIAAVSSGVFESAGDNAVRNNGANKVGTISVFAKE
ncbi:MAG: right-handed parallel beta-helix repeat-containing protein [Burkholderiales bacterium]|nr:right-handed parallel beta-helix repeat-containing protein [Burkholderiales bacterium]